MKFIWNEEKNKINIEKHNIRFENAIEVWKDRLSFDFYDDIHSSLEEDRWFKFGKMYSGKLFVLSIQSFQTRL